MVSAITVVAVAVVISLVAVSAKEEEGDYKCTPGKEEKRMHNMLLERCYEEVTDKEYSDDVWEEENAFTDEEEKAFGECVGKATGMINDDGTVNVETSEQAINALHTDDDTKAKLIAGVEKCAAKRGEIDEVVDCLYNVYVEVCIEPELQ